MGWIMILAMVFFLGIAVLMWLIAAGADDPFNNDLDEQQEAIEKWLQEKQRKSWK